MSFKRYVKIGLNKLRLRSKSCIIADYAKVSLKSLISHSQLMRGVSTSNHASVNFSTIGDYSSIGRNTKVTHTSMGRYCAISWDCTINAISHPINNLTVSAFPYVPSVGGFVQKRTQEYTSVEIGSDVWIGCQAIIMPGIKIGDGAIIGAGSIVTKNVEAYEIVAGNPAKHIRFRFEEEIRKQLLELQWWNWPEHLIRENINLFQRQVTKDCLQEIQEISSD